MNSAEIVAVLNTIEQDHQLVLDKIQALKETVAYFNDPEDKGLQQALARLQELDRYFTRSFTAHLDEEEVTLFPFVERYKPEGAEVIARLRAEHTEIRCKMEEFSNCLQVASELEEGLTRMVVRDLLGYGWELWELLDNHAHLETQAVHQCL